VGEGDGDTARECARFGLSVLVANGLQVVVFDASPWDLGTYGVVLGVLVATGVAAILVPALRATRIDPMEALRYD